MIQRLLKKLISGCSFRRQLSVAFTIGILILALVSSVATSWLGHERAKANLIEHGKQISQNLARQSILALLYAEGENAREAAQGALEFPDVRYVAIYDMHDHALLEQGDTDVSRKNFTLPEINDSNVVEEKANYWRIANYVYTDAVAAEEDFLLADAPQQQRLGRVELIISKDTLHKAMVGGFMVNISISLALALLLLAVLQFFTRQLTHPLYNLSDIMKKAKQGQTNVQALLEGPKEISTMALAFNNMMAVLEQRDQQLRDQNEQLEQRVANRTAELALARDDALRASQAKSQFLATMSHEIRTPMNGVLGMLQLLGKTELNTRQQHYVGTASDSGEMLLTVINDILDFSKLEAGKLELEAIPFDPVKLVEDTATLMAKSAYEKGVELLCSIGPDMPSLVKGDPTRLRQVLTNLVNNAIKFTDQGDIVLYAEILEEDLIHFGVRDTGIGIAEEAQQQLFEAFTQADSSHTRKYGGTGLGLAICQRLVQAMGGHLEVASAPGLGSNFGFDLPLKQVPLEDNQAQQYQQLAGQLKQQRILLVDHNRTSREVLTRMLGNCSASLVDDAETGAEALQRLRAAAVAGQCFDIALLDMHTPATGGLQLAQAIRRDEMLRGMRLVMLSAVHRTLAAPELDAWLSKPVRRSELYKTLLQLNEQTTGSIENAATGEPMQHWWFGGRLLLVEDNPVNQEVAWGILGEAGFAIDIRENGAEALQAVQEQHYDAVLMDIQMPVMDGLEATRRIRALGGRFIALPIIAMTAHALSGDADKSLAAGMNAHVTKPIQPQLLFKEIAHWIKPGEKPLMADNQETDEPIPKTAMPEIPATETSMPTPMPESLPGIDLTDGLDRLCGNWATYRYILLMFRDKHADAADRLEKFIVEGQWEEAERLAHTLKGGGGNLGAKRLYEQAAALEQNCRAADTENAQAALTTLRSHLDEVMGGLKQLAESGTTTEQSAGSGSVATPQETTVLLGKMLHALDCDLGEAQSCLAALRQQVADSEFAGPLAALQQALNNFDTEAAKETVQALHNLTRSRKEAS